jgi:hypothetical protein
VIDIAPRLILQLHEGIDQGLAGDRIVGRQGSLLKYGPDVLKQLAVALLFFTRAQRRGSYLLRPVPANRISDRE